jgi:LPS O-antigen subunit length determinant protein (WzzB/FepE family)
MNKKSQLYKDEINLIILLEIILNNKLKVALIVFISALIGFIYSYQLPNMYLHSLDIKSNHINKFLKIKLIRQSLNYDNAYPVDQIVLNQFGKELKDYQEFILAIKDTKKFKDNYSKLPLTEQNQILNKHIKFLEINKVQEEENFKFVLNFKSDNTEEAKGILKDTIKLTLDNLKSSICMDLEYILRVRKKDSTRVDFLKEQSEIAEELNISDIQSTSPTKNGYYLLGYKAINKEIEIIQKRDRKKFTLIEKEINSLKKEAVEWINYDINLIKVKSLKETKLILILSTLLGLIVGIFYVLIINALQHKSVSKKRIN